MKCAMFPATGGGNYLVIQSCSSVTDDTSTSMPRYSWNSACWANTHINNNGHRQRIHAADTNYRCCCSTKKTNNPDVHNYQKLPKSFRQLYSLGSPTPSRSTVEWSRISVKICSNFSMVLESHILTTKCTCSSSAGVTGTMWTCGPCWPADCQQVR